jgi:hypothetical protein
MGGGDGVRGARDARDAHSDAYAGGRARPESCLGAHPVLNCGWRGWGWVWMDGCGLCSTAGRRAGAGSSRAIESHTPCFLFLFLVFFFFSFLSFGSLYYCCVRSKWNAEIAGDKGVGWLSFCHLVSVVVVRLCEGGARRAPRAGCDSRTWRCRTRNRGVQVHGEYHQRAVWDTCESAGQKCELAGAVEITNPRQRLVEDLFSWCQNLLCVNMALTNRLLSRRKSGIRDGQERRCAMAQY